METATLIALQNDAFRQDPFRGRGRIFFTQGVQALPSGSQLVLLGKVRTYDSWEPGNDPYQEHDFGSLEFKGTSYLWKIDYFADRRMNEGAEDPSDSSTFRVLTIMRADEY